MAISKVVQDSLNGGVAGTGPAFSVYRGSTQSISNNTATKIQFNVEEYDTNNNFDSTTNYRFIPTVAGYYQINLTCYFSGTSGTNLQLYIYKNGTNYKTSLAASGISVGDYNISVTTLVYLNGSTDYIEGWGYMSASSGNSFYDAGNGRSTYMTGVLLRST